MIDTIYDRYTTHFSITLYPPTYQNCVKIFELEVPIKFNLHKLGNRH